MTRSYKLIPTAPLQKGASFHKPRQVLPEQVSADDLALQVMTDFQIVTAYTIFPLETIEDARAKMIHRGVRMLLVVDDMNQILGLITSSDLTGEKPMQVVQHQGIRHSDVLVKDIMTPRETSGSAVHGRSGEGVCRRYRRHHEGAGAPACAGGRTPFGSQPDAARHVLRVADRKQLGAHVEPIAVARTFAEIGAELAR